MAVGWEDSELFPEGLILKLERNAIASCWMKFKHISLCRLSPLFVHLKYIGLFIQQVTNKQDGKKKMPENSEILIFTTSIKLENKEIPPQKARIGLAQDLKLALLKISLILGKYKKILF